MRTLFATLIPLSLLLWLSLPVMADDDGSIRLGIEAVDSDLAYFDLSLEPGDSTDLTVRFSNHGEIGTGASVFAADVSTLHGGGMDMGDIDDPRTGATNWLSFEDGQFDLLAGDSAERTFTVSVPDDAAPGDYITAIVIQNTEPVEIESGAADFSQTIRQGIAVAIDVPGEQDPAMEFGAARHSVTGSSSVVEVDLENTGNAHLRPSGTFALQDTEGDELAASPIGLDTLYAGTSTVIEVMFTNELPANDYLISVSVEDEETGARASADDLELRIAAPETTPVSEDGLAGAVDAAEDTLADDPVLTALIAGTLAVIGVLILMAAVILGRTRRDSSPEQVPAPAGQSLTTSPVSTPSEKRREPRAPIRQLMPRARREQSPGEL